MYATDKHMRNVAFQQFFLTLFCELLAVTAVSWSVGDKKSVPGFWLCSSATNSFSLSCVKGATGDCPHMLQPCIIINRPFNNDCPRPASPNPFHCGWRNGNTQGTEKPPANGFYSYCYYSYYSLYYVTVYNKTTLR